ncbi:MAG: trypsin-like peptidase domain-containing protein [Elusimicrobiota bacterium]|nr:trypsin-like peptidase domain-containing protein [Elusimicrobiota bacterium]
MMTSPRRALSILLAAALLMGSVPPAVQAQVVRVASGQTGSMPVSPVIGSASGMTMAPSLAIGAASLNGTLGAPSIAPSPIASPAAVSAAAPVVAPAALSAAVRAAASENAPLRPDAPQAAAAPATKKSLISRVTSLFSRKPAAAPVAVPSAESAKTAADLAFDGASAKRNETEGPAVSASRLGGFKASLLKQHEARKTLSAAKRAASIDEFGGPLATPMTFRQRLGYGLKQGLNLVGLGAILEVTLRPLLNVFPWPQYMSDTALSAFGRVALLTKYGPNEIVEGLAQSPAAFLGIQLPFAVGMEELTFRLLGFGGTFLVLAALKPLTRKISSMIEELPDAAGVVRATKRVLRAGEWLSRLAFPIAASISAMSFAMAHFAAWGFSPFVLALNVILGLFLAHTAYKSRSLAAPFVAHLLFNLVAIGGFLIALSVSPFAGAAFGIIAGLLGVASLLYGYLSRRKERAFRMSGAKALATVMIVASTFSLFNAPATNPSSEAAARAAITQVQHAQQALPPEVADAIASLTGETAPVESREAMVARVKPSVVNVLVRMGQGMATGSGFILTPDGVFITNAHVVGTRKPGEFVEARVPGAPSMIKAKVLAVNHDKDLAIVQLAPRGDGKPWPFVKLASQAPREGEEVTATGYPRGLPFTVTAGVVSGMDGRGNMYVKHMQTDASINPGNSGGPLFNSRGEVIGVNTQIFTMSGGSDGLGFSIMAPEVARVMAQYAQTGNIATASMGIIANLSDPLAPEAGLEIEYVRHGSAAEKAGLLRGDLIIAVGGEPIAEGRQEAAGHVAAVLSKMIPGQKTTVTVLRGDEPVEIVLTADAKPTRAPQR